MEHFNQIIQQIANNHGVTTETVLSEIENAIHTTMDTAAQEGNEERLELWHSISPTYPSAEVLIAWIVKRLTEKPST